MPATLSARAQVAPPKPPPTTTTRAASCASARGGAAAAAANPARSVRRFTRMMAPLRALRAEPGRNSPDRVVREAAGEAVHHGRGPPPGAVFLHGRNDLGRIASMDRR